MDPNYCVLDISSDEEPDFKDQQVNLEWFCDQLIKDVDDSDDIVIVREVLNSEQYEKNCLNNPVAAISVDEKKLHQADEDKYKEEEDDDDCVVLDGDPDKMVSVEENQEDGSDELVVVGEKGQVACRDYPHPRHLCVKYPFSATLHKFHCEQCHCYVCDIVAPCNLWGTGMSIVDHCHATDNLEVWKTERKNFKLKRCSSLPAIKMSEKPSSLVPSTVSTQILSQPHPLTRSITMPSNHFPLHSMPLVPAVRSVLSPPAFCPVLSASVVHPVLSTPSLRVPIVMNPRSGSYRFPQSTISQQLLGGYTKYIDQRVRYQNATGLEPQHIPFKRTRSGVAYQAAYQSGHGQPHCSISSYASSMTGNQPVGRESVNGDHRPHQWVDVDSNLNTGTVRNPLPQSHYVNMPHATEVYQDVTSNQPATVSAQNFNQQVAYPSVMTASLPHVSVPWVDSTNSISTQWAWPLQAEFASHPDASVIWTDKTNTKSRQWDQLQPIDVSSAPNASAPWADNSNSSQSDQHLQPDALGNHSSHSMNAASNYLHNEHSGKGSDDQALAVPELENLHFEFEDWLMENQHAAGNQIEPPFFSDQNILSPDNVHIDSALLYDDEWNLIANIADV